MLEVRDLLVEIAGSAVLRGISLDVAAGELVCLIGRNGAGKTTTFRSIMGYRKPTAGSIRFNRTELTSLRTFQIARLGIAFAPEESEVFGELTVGENIAMPTWMHASERDAEQRIADAYNVFPQLNRYRARGGHALSGGERKMVSIARALAMGPKMLLLDEPTEGLSPAIVPSIIDGFAKIRTFGHAVFIAESNMQHVPEFTDRLYVLERGEIIYAGRPEGTRANASVRRVIEGAMNEAD